MKKMNGTRRFVLRSLCVAAMSSMQPFALAQDGAWPNRPIKLIVPSTPGGAQDTIARQFANSLAERLGQPVVVENRPGANASIGTAFVAKSAPDGYTLLLASSAMIQNPIHYKNVGYDPLKDFTPIGRLGASPAVLAVRSDRKITNLDQFIKAARGKNLNYGAPSTGTLVVMEIFNAFNNLGMTGVQYKGEAPALTDLIGGQIEVGIFSVFAVKGHLQSGKLTAIAVVADGRASSLPNVPTFVEQGPPELHYTGGWFAFMAPAGTPPEIVARLTREFKAIQDKPSERKRLEDMDLVINWTDGPAFAPQMKRDMDTWRDLVKKSKVVVEQ